MSASEESDTLTRVGPSHQHIVRLPSHRTESEPNSWYLWMSLIIQEYAPMLCHSHFADGGIMLLVIKKHVFSCCPHHRICKDWTNSSTLKDSFAFIYLFIYFSVSCLTRKLFCNQCNLLAVYWYHCPLMLKSLSVELPFVSE